MLVRASAAIVPNPWSADCRAATAMHRPMVASAPSVRTEGITQWFVVGAPSTVSNLLVPVTRAAEPSARICLGWSLLHLRAVLAQALVGYQLLLPFLSPFRYLLRALFCRLAAAFVVASARRAKCVLPELVGPQWICTTRRRARAPGYKSAGLRRSRDAAAAVDSRRVPGHRASSRRGSSRGARQAPHAVPSPGDDRSTAAPTSRPLPATSAVAASMSPCASPSRRSGASCDAVRCSFVHTKRWPYLATPQPSWTSAGGSRNAAQLCHEATFASMRRDAMWSIAGATNAT